MLVLLIRANEVMQHYSSEVLRSVKVSVYHLPSYQLMTRAEHKNCTIAFSSKRSTSFLSNVEIDGSFRRDGTLDSIN